MQANSEKGVNQFYRGLLPEQPSHDSEARNIIDVFDAGSEPGVIPGSLHTLFGIIVFLAAIRDDVLFLDLDPTY